MDTIDAMSSPSNPSKQELRAKADAHAAAAEELLGPPKTRDSEAGEIRNALKAVAHAQLAVYFQQSL